MYDVDSYQVHNNLCEVVN